MSTNKNSGVDFSADSDSNISKIAAQINPAGGLSLTDLDTTNTVTSGYTVNFYLSAGALYANNTATSQLSSIAAW
jgi:hypothetical protein